MRALQFPKKKFDSGEFFNKPKLAPLDFCEINSLKYLAFNQQLIVFKNFDLSFISTISSTPVLSSKTNIPLHASVKWFSLKSFLIATLYALFHGEFLLIVLI
jgi:hypothetical protein